MTTLPVAEARQQFSSLVEEAVKTHQRIHVTRNGRPAVVMIADDDFEAIMETIEVLSDPTLMRGVIESEHDAEAGRHITGDEMSVIMAARADGIDLGDETDVISDMHAAGVPDEVCMAALKAIIARHRQEVAE
ncbi:type II toxin-antitoxin system Phd/YefM family antitoxin [Actinomadura sp. 1N219]|uniref:type II toxin-antitoxin system Phd/YefM family antitoxin n=1 Tax=Actinomadura sp. 1N219 TaxID=3375152 RepID=UPI0037A584F7